MTYPDTLRVTKRLQRLLPPLLQLLQRLLRLSNNENNRGKIAANTTNTFQVILDVPNLFLALIDLCIIPITYPLFLGTVAFAAEIRVNQCHRLVLFSKPAASAAFFIPTVATFTDLLAPISSSVHDIDLFLAFSFTDYCIHSSKGNSKDRFVTHCMGLSYLVIDMTTFVIRLDVMQTHDAWLK